MEEGFVYEQYEIRRKPIKIIQGGHCSFVATLWDPTAFKPFDLTSATAVTTCFKNTDGSTLSLSLLAGIQILSPANLGQVQVDITAAQSALLRVIGLSTLEFAVSISNLVGGDPIKTQINKAYWVAQAVC